MDYNRVQLIEDRWWFEWWKFLFHTIRLRTRTRRSTNSTPSLFLNMPTEHIHSTRRIFLHSLRRKRPQRGKCNPDKSYSLPHSWLWFVSDQGPSLKSQADINLYFCPQIYWDPIDCLTGIYMLDMEVHSMQSHESSSIHFSNQSILYQKPPHALKGRDSRAMIRQPWDLF